MIAGFILFLLFGTLYFIIDKHLRLRRQIEENWTHTQCEIIGVRKEKYSDTSPVTYLTVKYSFNGEDYIETQTSDAYNEESKGDKVGVYINPETPSEIDFGRSRSYKFFFKALWLISVLGLIGSILLTIILLFFVN